MSIPLLLLILLRLIEKLGPGPRQLPVFSDSKFTKGQQSLALLFHVYPASTIVSSSFWICPTPTPLFFPSSKVMQVCFNLLSVFQTNVGHCAECAADVTRCLRPFIRGLFYFGQNFVVEHLWRQCNSQGTGNLEGDELLGVGNSGGTKNLLRSHSLMQ